MIFYHFMASFRTTFFSLWPEILSTLSVQFNCLQSCLLQSKAEHEKARELTKKLLKGDDQLVPKFLKALEETSQGHVVRILLTKGLNMSVVLYRFYVVCYLIDKILSQVTCLIIYVSLSTILLCVSISRPYF